MFGPADGGVGVQLSFEALCEKAGLTLFVPEEIRLDVLRHTVVEQGHSGRV